MSVSVLLRLILVTLLHVAQKLEVIGRLIYDGKAELKEKLEGILVQTDYASVYLQKISEMMGKEIVNGSEFPGSA